MFVINVLILSRRVSKTLFTSSYKKTKPLIIKLITSENLVKSIFSENPENESFKSFIMFVILLKFIFPIFSKAEIKLLIIDTIGLKSIFFIKDCVSEKIIFTYSKLF